MCKKTGLDRWIAKRRDETLRRWRANEIPFLVALGELEDLGYPRPVAWRMVEET